jgi:hypothetical protein
MPLASTSITVPLAADPEYRVTVENLSTRYVVRSVVWDKTNLVSEVMKLPAPLLSVPVAPGQQGAIAFTTTQTILGVRTVLILPPLPPVPTIEITLEEIPQAVPRTGVTLSGTMGPLSTGIEASGMPGSVYADGTFEIRNVPPGRHTILSTPAVRPRVAASIVVGDEDISGIRLQPIQELPRDPHARVTATLEKEYSPGTLLNLATVRGHLIDAATGARFNRGRTIGRITLNGNAIAYFVNNTGEFEIQSLLPGRYDLELWVFGGETYARTLEVRDENMILEWAVTVPD